MQISSIMCWAATVSVGLSSAYSGQVAPPPLPDFKTPVDYVDWYYDQFAPKIDDDALPLYEPILFDAKVKSLSASPRSKAGAQLFKLLANSQDWKPSENPELAGWTAKLEKRFSKLFVEVAGKSQMTVRRLSGLKFLLDRPTAKFVNGRAIGQMMFARAWRVEGRFVYSDHLAQAAKSNLAFADHMSLLPGLDEQFFAAGHRNFVYTQVLTALRSFVHRIHVWEDIAAAFDQFDSVPVTHRLARSLNFAEASALQQLQHFVMDGSGTKGGQPKIHQDVVNVFYDATSRQKVRRSPACKELAKADPVKLAQAIHDYYAQMRQLLMKPFVTNLTAELERIQKTYWDNQPGMECLVKPIDFAVQASFRTETLRRGSRLFLEKALHYKRTGRWPRTLDDLKHAAIATCRIDPYTGKDFLFRPSGDVEIVYSVGIDGKDDKADERKDIMIWTRVYTEKQGVPQDPIKKKDDGKPTAAAPKKVDPKKPEPPAKAP
ncbi:MAG: hypothetical protein GXP29_12490 [Planctomycetes bacterium]|nr:hypothetical protein [Planctomycetota bacterium]